MNVSGVSAPEPTVSRNPVAVVLLGMLGGYLAASILVVLWVELFGKGGVGPSLASSVGLWVGFVGSTAYEARSQQENVRELVQLRARWVPDLAVGGVGGVALQLGVIPVVYVLLEPVTGPLEVEGAAQNLTKDVAGLQWIAALLIIGVGAPIAEEIFFRGLVRRLIQERWGIAAGVIGSSAFFAATHFQLVQFPGLLVAGLAFAGLAATTGRLGPSIICHIAFNLTTLVQLMAR